MIEKILKAFFPATYRKIDKAEQKILATLIEQNSLLRTEISNLNRRIDSLENNLLQNIVNDMRPLLTEIKQTVENESNWKRADIVNDMRPLLAEIKQTVENESNWKRDDLVRNIEENKNLLRLLDFAQENMFYAMYKKDGESEIDAKKRFFKSIPEATGELRLLQKSNSVLLEKFKEICEENDLQYWLYGGTLLGAFRHEGFIPWDDDLDVGMLRSDIKKLLAILESNKEFKCSILFDWWAKCKQIRFRYRDEKIPFFVDVFIYDVYEGKIEKNFENENRVKLVDFFDNSMLPEVQYWREHPYLDIADVNFQKIERQFEKFSNHINALPRDFERYPSKTLIRSSENCMSPNRSVYDKIFDWNIVFPLKKLKFEGELYSVPNESEIFLLNTYKEIYKLPKDVFTHFEHIPHSELNTPDFRKMILQLLETRENGETL